MTTDLIDHNPLLKKPLLAMLALSEQNPDADRRTLERRALATWDDAYPQSPTVALDILVRNGALTEQVLVDGEPYDGTLEDIQMDEAVPDDATAESRVAITTLGREVLAAYAPDATLRALVADKPCYRAAFAAVLEACATADGRSRADLEAALDARPELAPDPATQRTRVYPQYFIDALEAAGGIAWDGAWRTTDAGRTLLAAELDAAPAAPAA